MGRLRLALAVVRAMLVAIGLCVLGAPSHAAPDAVHASDQPTHFDCPAQPDPGAVLTEERDEDERASEDDDAGPGARPEDAFPRADLHRIVTIRGPPVDPRPVAGRPRSSRGPPLWSDRPPRPRVV